MSRLLASAADGIRRAARIAAPPEDLDAPGLERWRVTFVVQIFSSIGLLFLAGLAIDNLGAGRVVLGLVDLALAALALANAIYLYRTRDHRRAKRVVSGILVFLYVYLLASGGVAGTGPLWCYVFVTMLMFVHGLREGAVVVGALIVISAAALLLPWPAAWVHPYPDAFIGRFLPSLLALFIMALLYEYARDRAERGMATTSARMQRAAYTDSLTGLANRRWLAERIDAEHERVRDGVAAPYCLLEIDVDGFKRVNDHYGHDAGDQLLAAVAECLAGGVRDGDLLGRWGGEEFLVLLPGTRLEDARHMAERLRALIADAPMDVAGQRLATTVSIGVARTGPEEARDAVLTRTDQRMYMAKAAGKNAVCAGDCTA